MCAGHEFGGGEGRAEAERVLRGVDYLLGCAELEGILEERGGVERIDHSRVEERQTEAIDVYIAVGWERSRDSLVDACVSYLDDEGSDGGQLRSLSAELSGHLSSYPPPDGPMATDACLLLYARALLPPSTTTPVPPSLQRCFALPALLPPLTLPSLKPPLKAAVGMSVGSLFVVVPHLVTLSLGQGYLVALNVAILFQAGSDSGSWEKSKDRLLGNGAALLFSLVVYDWFKIESVEAITGSLVAWAFFCFYVGRSKLHPYATCNAAYTASIALLGDGVDGPSGATFQELITVRMVVVLFGAVIAVVVELLFWPRWESGMVEEGAVDFLDAMADNMGGRNEMKTVKEAHEFCKLHLPQAIREVRALRHRKEQRNILKNVAFALLCSSLANCSRGSVSSAAVTVAGESSMSLGWPRLSSRSRRASCDM